MQVVAQLLKKDILPNTYVHQLLDLPETITLPTLVASTCLLFSNLCSMVPQVLEAVAQP